MADNKSEQKPQQETLLDAIDLYQHKRDPKDCSDEDLTQRPKRFMTRVNRTFIRYSSY